MDDHGMRDPDLGGTNAPDVVRPGPRAVPDEAASWIAKALSDPDAADGTITFRSTRAVFEMVRRFDATGKSGWES